MGDMNGGAQRSQWSSQGPQMNPYGNTNPYTPGGVTDQVNMMRAMQSLQGGMTQGPASLSMGGRPGYHPIGDNPGGLQSQMSPNQQMAAQAGTMNRNFYQPFNSPYSGPRGSDYNRPQQGMISGGGMPK